LRQNRADRLFELRPAIVGRRYDREKFLFHCVFGLRGFVVET